MTPVVIKKLLSRFSFFIPIFLYSIFAIVLTYPLITKLSSYIPGAGQDAYISLYNYWWFKFSIFNGLNIFSSPLLLHPYGANLALAASTFSNSLIISFLDLFFSSLMAFNLFILLSFVLSGFGTYQLLKYLIKNKPAAFLGGLFFAFHPYIFYELGAGHFNYATTWFIPFFLLFLLKATREKSKKYFNATLAALFLTISFYNDLYYTFGLLFILIIYFLFLLIEKKKKIVATLPIFLLIIAIFLFLSWPLSSQLLRAANSGEYPLATNQQISLYSPDIRSYFVPSPFNTFYGENFFKYYQSIISPHNSLVYLGYLLLALAIIAGFLKPAKEPNSLNNFFLVLGIFFFLFTLGPILFLGSSSLISSGRITIPLPYQLLYFFPFLKGVLVPTRLIIFLLLILTIPAAKALSLLLDKIKNNNFKFFFLIGVSSLILLEYSCLPLKLSPVDIPPVYESLKADKNNYSVLELPFALSTSFYTLGDIKSSSKIQYFQTVHQKAILGGYVARVPNEVYHYYQNLPGLRQLISPGKLRGSKPTEVEKEKIKKTFKDLKIKYIIVHPEYYVSFEEFKHQELFDTLNYLDQIFGPHFANNNLFIYQLVDY